MTPDGGSNSPRAASGSGVLDRFSGYAVGIDGDPHLLAVRRLLEERADDLRARIAALAARPERGAAQGFGKRIGDGTVEAISRLTDIGVGASTEVTLARIERALAKLDEGTYGICDECGSPIPAGRLRAMPESIVCVACAEAAPAPPSARR